MITPVGKPLLQEREHASGLADVAHNDIVFNGIAVVVSIDNTCTKKQHTIIIHKEVMLYCFLKHCS